MTSVEQDRAAGQGPEEGPDPVVGQVRLVAPVLSEGRDQLADQVRMEVS